MLQEEYLTIWILVLASENVCSGLAVNCQALTGRVD